MTSHSGEENRPISGFGEEKSSAPLNMGGVGSLGDRKKTDEGQDAGGG